MDRFKEKFLVLPIEVMVVLAINVVVAALGCYVVTRWGFSAISGRPRSRVFYLNTQPTMTICVPWGENRCLYARLGCASVPGWR
jgi:hypothetical protein